MYTVLVWNEQKRAAGVFATARQVVDFVEAQRTGRTARCDCTIRDERGRLRSLADLEECARH